MNLEDYLYYQDDWATIYCGDCREILPLLEPVDLVLTDPPYGVKKADWDNEVLDMDWLNTSRKVGRVVAFTPGVTHMFSYPEPNWSICWARSASCQRNGLGGFNNFELIFIYGTPKLDNDLITMSHPGRDTDGHECPKPLKLFKIIIERLKGYTILDPFMGSGTTLVAAKNLNRKSIGIEIEEKYCAIAKQRLRQEVFDFRGVKP